jgi:hypothetical protein
MPSPSKAKGNSWERQVAEHLTAMYGETFIRAPGSGAYVGGQNTVRKEFLHEGQIRAFKGDIVPGQSFPKFNAECKSYKTFPFHQLWQGHVKILEGWLDQLIDVADPGDFNILIMKFNHIGKWVAVEAKHNFLLSRSFNYGSIKHDHWHIIDYDMFWEFNSDQVRELCK